MLKYHEDGQAIIEEKRRFSGTYLENLELKDFPFDVQVGFICKVLQSLAFRFGRNNLGEGIAEQKRQDMSAKFATLPMTEQMLMKPKPEPNNELKIILISDN